VAGQRLFAALRSLVWGAGFVGIWVWLAFAVEPLDARIPFTISGWLRPVGWPLIAGGIALDLWCIAHFVLRGRGTPAPFDPPREFVATGPFRYVRNPMYLGAAATILGFGLAVPSPAVVLLSGAVLLWAHLFVVLYEEKTLETRFGESYLEYRRRVRRWWPLLGRNDDRGGTR
jgi:protein-S-isoprenylcysteine O-methyltransferase Ste14